jgi:glyoxylase-like metal-dependent hydrolase (beta-lactamase superfamily II)
VPLPWAATPHGNAWAVTAGDGIVLFDAGYGGPDGLNHLEAALGQVGLKLGDIRLVACTHTHADHFGCAASIAEATDCPVWLHPAWEHVRGLVGDPEEALQRRLAFARSHGTPEALLEELAEARRGAGTGVDGVVDPTRELVEGVEVETDLGAWVVHETPGHAPSHVVFHQPERGLLISGDMLVSQVFLYFDYGHTPDPAGEFRQSLDVVEALDVGLCLSGHGRPFREIPGKVRAFRAEFDRQLGNVRGAVTQADGPVTAFDLVSTIAGERSLDPMALGYAIEMTTSYLTHLEARREVQRLEQDSVVRWTGTNAAG